MDVDSLLQKRRDVVWKMVIQFFCYEYCMDCIHRNELTYKSSRWRIISDMLQELVQCQATENDTDSLYQLLMQFVMKSNKLLEEDCFEDQNDVIKECTELLKDLCRVSSTLKPMGQHINNLFENIKNCGLHNNEEEITEWKNVFTGSRMILLKEMLLLLPQPHLLKMVQNYNSNYILETSKDITTAVDILRSIDFEEEVIHDLKQKLIKDDTLVHIMKNALTKSSYNKESTASPEDSYRTAASTFTTTTSNKQHMNNRKQSERLLLRKLSESEAQSSGWSLRKKDRRSVTSSYFATPQPLPKLRTRKDDSPWKKVISELKRPLSPTSTTASSRNHTGLARKRMPWTLEEEELLVLGVEKYNVGNWKLILSDGGLENRTVRDLYDKWKNIKKYGHLDVIKTRVRLKQRNNHSN